MYTFTIEFYCPGTPGNIIKEYVDRSYARAIKKLMDAYPDAVIIGWNKKSVNRQSSTVK